MRKWLVAAALALVAAGAREASAAEPLGVIVRIDLKEAGAKEEVEPKGEAEIYIDIGADRGASDGAKVTLLRYITVRHPLTKKALRDLFPVGEATIDSARASMSLLKVPLAVGTILRVGDRAVLGGPPPPAMSPAAMAAVAPTRCPPCPERTDCPAAGSAAPATRALLATWRATLGRTPEARIALWREFLKRHAGSAETSFVNDEIARLVDALRVTRELRRTEQMVTSLTKTLTERPRPAARPAAAAVPVYVAPPEEVREGEPLEIAAATGPTIAALLLHYRGADEAFHTTRLATIGDGYQSAVIPAEAVRPPSMSYLVEAVDQAGRRSLVVGNEHAPQQVTVREAPAAEDRRNRSRIALRTEYVDFNGFRGDADADHYWVMEADFLYRLQTMLHAISVGFGSYNGLGAEFDRLNVPNPATHREVGYNYGYVGFELRFHEYFSTLARVLVGLNEDGLAGGFEGRIRIGREDGTNLQLGGATVNNIGTLGVLQLTWDVVKNFPMSGSVEVTDQPVQGDLGVRFIYDLGWRARSWWYPTLRVSFQARTIDHIGVGAGLASVFAW